jgi:endonuclease/exonuclease/phosphatase family metal-dependent hydrolase
VRLATFNVLHGRAPSDDRVDLDRFAAAVRELDADVLALQEVDRHQARSHGADLTAIAADAGGYASSCFAPALSGTPGSWWRTSGHEAVGTPQYGVALLVRGAVTSWEVVHLPGLPGRVPVLFPGRRRPTVVRDEPRVALVARLADGPTVLSTHLSFIPWWNRMQLRVLVRQMPAAEPIVLMGDLNLPPDVAARTTGLRPLGAGLTYPAHEPREQLDHLLARGVRATGPAVVRRLPLSDHCALVVDAEPAGIGRA